MKQQSKSFLLESEITWEVCGDGIKRQIMGYGPELMLVKACFETNSIGAMHQHVHTQSSIISSGKFEVTIDGEVKIMSKGDGYYVASNLVHGVVCLEEGILIETFSPCREDFLK